MSTFGLRFIAGLVGTIVSYLLIVLIGLLFSSDGINLAYCKNMAFYSPIGAIIGLLFPKQTLKCFTYLFQL
ncbi:hypothetical protein ACFPK9_02100 [Rubritalea spongiae]|uniref:Uncharacterized protein n=1 Tax=Rubritalea spongiae TaxID=430797 RepID=A0ABW5E6B2_9BACT